MLDDLTLDSIWSYGLCFNGYRAFDNVADIANERLEEFVGTGTWRGTARELRGCLFFEQRRWRHFGYQPEGEDLRAVLKLFATIQSRISEGQAAPNDDRRIDSFGAAAIGIDGVAARLLDTRRGENCLVLTIALDESGEVVERKCPPCQVASDDAGLLMEIDSV